MMNWKVVICLVAIIGCTIQAMEILERPIRPEKFGSKSELLEYLDKLKAFHQQNGQRFGKRFYAPPMERIPPRLSRWLLQELLRNENN